MEEDQRDEYIMLNITKSVTLRGESLIDGKTVATYQAVINSANNDITIDRWINNKTEYKANRTTVRSEQADFEDQAYTLQDEMATETATTTTTE